LTHANSPLSANYSYDVENRMVVATPTSGGQDIYSYGPDNLRVWKLRADGTEEIYYYDPAGRQLGVYKVTGGDGSNGGTLYLGFTKDPGTLQSKRHVYFRSQLIASEKGTAHEDRLGSVRGIAPYYPYGEEYTPTAQD